MNGRRGTEFDVMLYRVPDGFEFSSSSFTFDAIVFEIIGLEVITVVDGVAFVGDRVASVSSLSSLLLKK